MSSFATAKKSNQPSYVSLKLDQERALEATEPKNLHTSISFEHEDEDSETETEHDDEEVSSSAGDEVQARDLANEDLGEHDVEEAAGSAQSQETSAEQHDETEEQQEQEDKSSVQAEDTSSSGSDKQETHDSAALNEAESEESSAAAKEDKSAEIYETDNTHEMPGVEVRLKQISQEVEKRTNEENRHIPSLTPDLDDIGHQSFLSLTDLIRTLRPNDKQIIPQIDSDYSNAMRVLGEKSVVVNNNNNNEE